MCLKQYAKGTRVEELSISTKKYELRTEGWGIFQPLFPSTWRYQSRFPALHNRVLRNDLPIEWPTLLGVGCSLFDFSLRFMTHSLCWTSHSECWRLPTTSWCWARLWCTTCRTRETNVYHIIPGFVCTSRSTWAHYRGRLRTWNAIDFRKNNNRANTYRLFTTESNNTILCVTWLVFEFICKSSGIPARKIRNTSPIETPPEAARTPRTRGVVHVVTIGHRRRRGAPAWERKASFLQKRSVKARTIMPRNLLAGQGSMNPKAEFLKFVVRINDFHPR